MMVMMTMSQPVHEVKITKTSNIVKTNLPSCRYGMPELKLVREGDFIPTISKNCVSIPRNPTNFNADAGFARLSPKLHENDFQTISGDLRRFGRRFTSRLRKNSI
ncbi:MAG: hypothetical protein WB558_06715 [Terriglobales bacterium]